MVSLSCCFQRERLCSDNISDVYSKKEKEDDEIREIANKNNDDGFAYNRF